MIWSHCARAVPLDVCGVYFLLSKGELRYIGQSTNVVQRCFGHRLRKEFDEAVYIPCEKEDLDQLEGAAIRYFDPIENGHRRQPTNRSTCPGDPSLDKEVLRKYGFKALPNWVRSLEKMETYRRRAA